jgi:hypothetical protein
LRKKLIVLFLIVIGNLGADEIIPLKVIFRGDALSFVGYIWLEEHQDQFAIVHGTILSIHRLGETILVYLRTTGRDINKLECYFPLSEIDNLRQYRRGQTLHLQGQIRTNYSSQLPYLRNCVVLENNDSSSLER